MPSKDPVKRKKTLDAWKKRSYTPAYMKWLYGRRMFPKKAADEFRDVLTTITKESTDKAIADLAAAALQWEHIQAAKLGNRFDHERDEPFWKEPS